MKISKKQAIQSVAVLALACVLAGCGGGSNASIGGTVSGLSTGVSVTLQDNNTDNLTMSSDQGFTFPTTLGAGVNYSVSVLNQPVGQTCLVGNGTGTIDAFADSISNVTVTCSMTSSVGGTVAGLAAGNGIWLMNNGQLLPIAANGSFAFPGVLAAGSTYNVSISTQPAQQTCVVTNGIGVVSSAAMANVTIRCS
ncbi:MAG: hypothetical protein JWQ33_1728 [Ramlibacter sp.]|nr:hypothetical protein [Ramlibacter sp.]